MVCLGNICRSPLAEGILQDKFENAGLDWIVSSAGTTGYQVGIQPHKLSQKVALLNGIDIGGQQCSQFRKEDMLGFDRIYVMDNENYQDVKRISGELWDAGKVKLLLDELYPAESRNVPDPWYGGEQGYHEVYEMIDRACDKIVERYREW
jgi:protein-tyrosine phosphatase